MSMSIFIFIYEHVYLFIIYYLIHNVACVSTSIVCNSWGYKYMYFIFIYERVYLFII